MTLSSPSICVLEQYDICCNLIKRDKTGILNAFYIDLIIFLISNLQRDLSFLNRGHGGNDVSIWLDFACLIMNL